MDPDAPSSYTAHRASFGVRPRRSASSPRLTRHPRRLEEACICLIHVDPDEAANAAAGVPDLDDSTPPTWGRTLPDI